MLQTQTPKVEFKRGSIHIETFFLNKFNFETGMRTGKYNFPALIVKDGKDYRYERRIFEGQTYKWIYSEVGAYQTKNITIW